MLSRKEGNMKIFQKVQGNLATNLYVTSNNKTAFASKPVASVNATLTRMNVKTGSERLLKSFKTSSANEALRLAEKQFGEMAEVKIAYVKTSSKWEDASSEDYDIDNALSNSTVKVYRDDNDVSRAICYQTDDWKYNADIFDSYGDFVDSVSGLDSLDDAVVAAEKELKQSSKTSSRTFKTARRKLSMQEKLRLIDEDRLEDDDFDL